MQQHPAHAQDGGEEDDADDDAYHDAPHDAFARIWPFRVGLAHIGVDVAQVAPARVPVGLAAGTLGSGGGRRWGGGEYGK